LGRIASTLYLVAASFLRIDSDQPSEQTLRLVASELSHGRLIAYPTDTLYGLAADPCNDSAVDRVYRMKARSPLAPLPLIAANIEQIRKCVKRLSPLSYQLAERFWPGPLTLIYDAGETLAPAMLAGGKTVAVRVPAHAVATGIARVFGHPITATSANLTGVEPVSEALAVAKELLGDLSLILDGGVTAGGLPSTIIDARGVQPVLIREGIVPWERVLQSLA